MLITTYNTCVKRWFFYCRKEVLSLKTFYYFLCICTFYLLLALAKMLVIAKILPSFYSYKSRLCVNARCQINLYEISHTHRFYPICNISVITRRYLYQRLVITARLVQINFYLHMFESGLIKVGSLLAVWQSSVNSVLLLCYRTQTKIAVSDSC